MYLGIDVGTSEVKAVLVDESQRLVAKGHAPLEVSRPHPRWSEQDPDDWWRATQAAVAQIQRASAAQLAAVRGIGLSGQMHGAVLLDSHDRVLRPAILWNDTRSADECAELERRAPESRRITGNLAMPGFTAPKLLWVARHEPDVMRRTARVLLPKDHVRLHLTGEHVSDMSDSAGTMWLDVAARDWSDVMLSATNLSRGHMPRLVEGTEASGQLRPEVARGWGMKEAVVAGGGGDNASSAVGLGVVSEGQGFISLGTSGVFFAATAGYRPDPERGVHTFCHALPGVWHQMAVMLSAASCLRWAAGATGATDEAALLAEVERVSGEAAARAPLFLPYLSGERTPHNDPFAEGVWFGLRHESDRAALGYSVLEGVAFGLADGYQALRDAGGAVRSVCLTGGGSRSRLWARLIASALDMPLAVTEGSELGAALGAARLGRLAAQPEADVAAVCRQPPVVAVIEPERAWRELMLPRFERFRALYPSLRPLFRAMQ
jgi:xylulokinase